MLKIQVYRVKLAAISSSTIFLRFCLRLQWFQVQRWHEPCSFVNEQIKLDLKTWNSWLVCCGESSILSRFSLKTSRNASWFWPTATSCVGADHFFTWKKIDQNKRLANKWICVSEIKFAYLEYSGHYQVKQTHLSSKCYTWQIYSSFRQIEANCFTISQFNQSNATCKTQFQM